MRHDLHKHKKEIQELLSLGVPQTRIALRFDVSLEQLRYFLRQNKIKRG